MKKVICFEEVSKKYYLGSRRAYIAQLVPGLAKKSNSSTQMSPESNEFWALKDVSFDAYEGEILGIIGPNGAGKTTALSMLAGITNPTSGSISVYGRIGALIKLGAGFHPELTGRENIYLNGAILGLRKAEIDKIYNDIVDFSDLRDFINTPVKRYSSGMYVRLGFAVAVHIDPDILLVDEVLSVGDMSFQTRCFNRIGQLSESGVTIIFVSHNMHHIKNFCNRVIYINKGKIIASGEPGEVIEAYTAEIMKNQANDQELIESDLQTIHGTGRIAITDVLFFDEGMNQVDQIKSGESVIVRVYYRCNEKVENPVLDVVIRDTAVGNMYQMTNRDAGFEFGQIEGSGMIDICLENITSNNQVLNFFFTFWNSSHTEQYDWKRYIKLFVMGSPASSGRLLLTTEYKHHPLLLEES